MKVMCRHTAIESDAEKDTLKYKTNFRVKRKYETSKWWRFEPDINQKKPIRRTTYRSRATVGNSGDRSGVEAVSSDEGGGGGGAFSDDSREAV